MVEGLNPMEAFGRAKAKAATEEKMRLQKMHAEHVLENFRWAMGNLAFVQGAYELGMQAIEKDPQGVIAEKFTSALDKSFAIANKESSILHDMETLRANDVHAKENGTPDEQRLWNLEEQAYNSRNELAHVLRDALRPIIRVAANLDYANDGENVRDEDCPPSNGHACTRYVGA